MLFRVLVYVFNFNLFEFSAAILEKVLLSRLQLLDTTNRQFYYVQSMPAKFSLSYLSKKKVFHKKAYLFPCSSWTCFDSFLCDATCTTSFDRNGELHRNQIGRCSEQVNKRMKNSPSCVHVLAKTLNLIIYRNTKANLKRTWKFGVRVFALGRRRCEPANGNTQKTCAIQEHPVDTSYMIAYIVPI